MRSVMVAFDGGVLDRAVHAFHLPVRPGMFDFGEPVFDVVFRADPVKDMRKGVFIASPIGELDAVVGEDMSDFIRHGRDQVTQKACGNHLCLAFMKFYISEL